MTFALKCEAVEVFGDDNNGFPFGLEYYASREGIEDGEILDVEWFKTEAERAKEASKKGIKLIK